MLVLMAKRTYEEEHHKISFIRSSLDRCNARPADMENPCIKVEKLAASLGAERHQEQEYQ